MILLYRGRYAPAVRGAFGVVLLILGHLSHRGTIFGLAGAALIVWGIVGAITGWCAGNERAGAR
jgi:hypothetical protein